MAFADELARLHAACDGVFGVAAVFQPVSGDPVPGVMVERFRPEPELGLEHARTAIADELLRVSKSALPKRPAKGDLWVIGEETLRTIEAPLVEDDDGLRWTVKVEGA